MLNATFRPLTQWPGKRALPGARRRSPFRATYARTLDDLEHEIDHLKGKSVTIQIDVQQRDIRNDGWPRSGARPKEPGVVVSFQSSKGPLSFACDSYVGWEDNLRAISLTMEALRAVDRYGATKGAEQYRGFAQIEAPARHAPMTRDDAAKFISAHTQPMVHWMSIATEPAVAERAYRIAAAKLHPDRGGSHDQFVQLGQARQVLGC